MQLQFAQPVFSLLHLPNKSQLLAELKNFLERNSQIAVAVIDLDKFKEVNDTRGHPAGDACLERVVKAMGSTVGQKGTLYRWGGDEFVVVLPDFSTEETIATAERIRKTVEQSKAGEDIPVTASIGVCSTDQLQNATAEILLKSADDAMYASKTNGKNRVTPWSVELTSR